MIFAMVEYSQFCLSILLQLLNYLLLFQTTVSADAAILCSMKEGIDFGLVIDLKN